jgi:hypothetical protein
LESRGGEAEEAVGKWGEKRPKNLKTAGFLKVVEIYGMCKISKIQTKKEEVEEQEL